jgi:hypothetical protein
MRCLKSFPSRKSRIGASIRITKVKGQTQLDAAGMNDSRSCTLVFAFRRVCSDSSYGRLPPKLRQASANSAPSSCFEIDPSTLNFPRSFRPRKVGLVVGSFTSCRVTKDRNHGSRRNRVYRFYVHDGLTRKANKFAFFVGLSKSGQECRAAAAKSIRPVGSFPRGRGVLRRRGGPMRAASFTLSSALSRRFGKERPNNPLHFGAVALRTLNFFCFVLLHGQDFSGFLTALGADVFVDGHSFGWLWGFRLVAHGERG